MSDAALELEEVSLRFPLLRYEPRGLKELLLGRQSRSKEELPSEFWALKNVTLRVRRGEVLGVIGANGAGKSTLLKVAAGIYRPNRGIVRAHGKISSLLELGAGFKDELTGLENIHLNATILGYPPDEIEKRAQEIINFAGLEKFIHQPLRTYSSGMRVRLGFAIASVMKPEILLVDEVLAVGDEEFRNRSMARLEEMAAQQTTIVIVSHALNILRRLCGRIVLLEQGELVAEGDPAEVLDRYLGKSPAPPAPPPPPPPPSPPAEKADTGAVEIIETKITDQDGQPVEQLPAGGRLIISIELLIKEPIERPLLIGFSMLRDQLTIAAWNSREAPLTAPPPGSRAFVEFHLSSLDLMPGDYLISVGVYSLDDVKTRHDLRPRCLKIRATSDRTLPSSGIWFPPGEWRLGTK